MTATAAQLRSTVAFQMALDRKRLARNVIALREAKHWNQAKLIRESGVSTRTVQRIEKPRPADMGKTVRLDTLEAIADVLGVSTDDLTGGSDVVAAAGPTPDLMGQLNGDAPEWAVELDRKLDIIKASIDALAAQAHAEAKRPTGRSKTSRGNRKAA